MTSIPKNPKPQFESKSNINKLNKPQMPSELIISEAIKLIRENELLEKKFKLKDE